MPRQIVYYTTLLGLCDRLRGLIQTIRYCAKNDCILCVDWTDMVWGVPFEEFFSIRLIETITPIELFKKIEEENLSINPPIWTLEMMKGGIQHSQMTKEHCAAFFQEEYMKECPKESGDVLYANAAGVAIYDWPLFFNCVRFTPKFIDILKPYTAIFEDNKYALLIHLRATDRPSDIFEKMSEVYDEFPIEGKINCYVMSDSKKIAVDWIEKYPECSLLRPEAAVWKIPTGHKGSHYYSDVELKEYGTNKYDLSKESLLDLVLLALSPGKVGMAQSYFYQFAFHMYACDNLFYLMFEQ